MVEDNQTIPAYAAPTSPVRRASLTTTGPLWGKEDIAGLIASAVMILLPLAMGAFWAP